MTGGRKLLLLYGCGVALYFFTNLQRSGIPGSLFNELQSAFQCSAAQVAMLGTVFIYIYAVNQLVAGILADRYGGIRLMIFGSFFFCCGGLLFPLSGSIWSAYAARAIVGFGASFMYLSMVKLTQRMFPRILPQMVGLLLLLGYSGSITANAPLSLFAAACTWRTALFTAGVSAAILLGVFFTLRNEVPQTPVRNIPFSFRPFLDFARKRHNRMMCLFSGGNFGFYFVLQVIIGKKFLEDFAGMSGRSAALIMSIMALCAAFSGVITATLSRLSGNRRKIFAQIASFYALTAFAVILFCILNNIHTPVLALLVGIFGFTGNMAPINVALLNETNPPERTGIAVSASNFFSYFCVSVFGSAAGFLMDIAAPSRIGEVLVYGRWSYAAVFGFLLLIAIICAASSCRLRETYGKNIADTID